MIRHVYKLILLLVFIIFSCNDFSIVEYSPINNTFGDKVVISGRLASDDARYAVPSNESSNFYIVCSGKKYLPNNESIFVQYVTPVTSSKTFALSLDSGEYLIYAYGSTVTLTDDEISNFNSIVENKLRNNATHFGYYKDNSNRAANSPLTFNDIKPFYINYNTSDKRFDVKDEHNNIIDVTSMNISLDYATGDFGDPGYTARFTGGISLPIAITGDDVGYYKVAIYDMEDITSSVGSATNVVTLSACGVGCKYGYAQKSGLSIGEHLLRFDFISPKGIVVYSYMDRVMIVPQYNTDKWLQGGMISTYKDSAGNEMPGLVIPVSCLTKQTEYIYVSTVDDGSGTGSPMNPCSLNDAITRIKNNLDSDITYMIFLAGDLTGCGSNFVFNESCTINIDSWGSTKTISNCNFFVSSNCTLNLKNINIHHTAIGSNSSSNFNLGITNCGISTPLTLYNATVSKDASIIKSTSPNTLTLKGNVVLSATSPVEYVPIYIDGYELNDSIIDFDSSNPFTGDSSFVTYVPLFNKDGNEIGRFINREGKLSSFTEVTSEAAIKDLLEIYSNQDDNLNYTTSVASGLAIDPCNNANNLSHTPYYPVRLTKDIVLTESILGDAGKFIKFIADEDVTIYFAGEGSTLEACKNGTASTYYVSSSGSCIKPYGGALGFGPKVTIDLSYVDDNNTLDGIIIDSNHSSANESNVPYECLLLEGPIVNYNGVGSIIRLSSGSTVTMKGGSITGCTINGKFSCNLLNIDYNIDSKIVSIFAGTFHMCDEAYIGTNTSDNNIGYADLQAVTIRNGNLIIHDGCKVFKPTNSTYAYSKYLSGGIYIGNTNIDNETSNSSSNIEGPIAP